LMTIQAWLKLVPWMTMGYPFAACCSGCCALSVPLQERVFACMPMQRRACAAALLEPHVYDLTARARAAADAAEDQQVADMKARAKAIGRSAARWASTRALHATAGRLRKNLQRTGIPQDGGSPSAEQWCLETGRRRISCGLGRPTAFLPCDAMWSIRCWLSMAAAFSRPPAMGCSRSLRVRCSWKPRG
jgi:hypothetical protein